MVAAPAWTALSVCFTPTASRFASAIARAPRRPPLALLPAAASTLAKRPSDQAFSAHSYILAPQLKGVNPAFIHTGSVPQDDPVHFLCLHRPLFIIDFVSSLADQCPVPSGPLWAALSAFG